MKIFSGTANPPLARKIASILGLSLSPLEIFVFPDGERRIRAEELVVDEHCVIVQPTSPPVDQNYMELLFIADALKRSGASSITAVIPYLGYQRQDHVFREGEAVSLDVVIKMLESTGVSKIITFDLHSIKIPELFHLPIVHLSALPLFAEKIKKEGWTSNVTLISPDMGGIRRIKQLSVLLNNMPYGAIEKNRDLATGHVEASEIKELTAPLGKRAIIVDDMIASGKTIVTAANLLFSKGVKEVYVFATHPVFSEGAAEILQNSKAKKIFVTDSIAIPKEKHFANLEIISIVDMIAENL